jgi:hypothetical protein
MDSDYRGLAYATEVLDPVVHDRLVADLDHYAHQAGIQPHYIWTPLANTCNAMEVAWIRSFLSEEKDGLILSGPNPDPSIESQLSAMAGALVRNFINARVMTLNQFLDATGSGNTPDQTCLFIPNFFVEKGTAGAGVSGSSLPAWRLNLLLDGLTSRALDGNKTVIYVSDPKQMRMEYGAALHHLLANTFKTVTV